MTSVKFPDLFSLQTLVLYTVILAAVSFLSLPAATASEHNSNIQQVFPERVNNCEFIGEVKGSSGWGRIAIIAWPGKAKGQALQQPQRLGATHLVWARFHNGYGSGPYAYGEAYNYNQAEKKL